MAYDGTVSEPMGSQGVAAARVSGPTSRPGIGPDSREDVLRRDCLGIQNGTCVIMPGRSGEKESSLFTHFEAWLRRKTRRETPERAEAADKRLFTDGRFSLASEEAGDDRGTFWFRGTGKS